MLQFGARTTNGHLRIHSIWLPLRIRSQATGRIALWRHSWSRWWASRAPGEACAMPRYDSRSAWYSFSTALMVHCVGATCKKVAHCSQRVQASAIRWNSSCRWTVNRASTLDRGQTMTLRECPLFGAHHVRDASQSRLVRPIASDKALTRMRLTAQIASRWNQKPLEAVVSPYDL